MWVKCIWLYNRYHSEVLAGFSGFEKCLDYHLPSSVVLSTTSRVNEWNSVLRIGGQLLLGCERLIKSLFSYFNKAVMWLTQPVYLFNFTGKLCILVKNLVSLWNLM